MATYLSGQYQLKRRDKVLVAAGETTPWYLLSAAGASIVCSPGANGSMVAQVSQDPPEIILNDNTQGTSNAIAVPWPLGSVSTNQGLQVTQITVVRFMATAAAGIGEISE